MAPALHAAGLRTLAPDQRGYSPGARPPGGARTGCGPSVTSWPCCTPRGWRSAHVVGHDGAARGLGGGRVAPGPGPDDDVAVTPHPAAMTRALATSDQGLRSYYMAVQPPRAARAADARPRWRVPAPGPGRGGLPAPVADHYVAAAARTGGPDGGAGLVPGLPWTARDAVGTVRVPTLHVWSTGDAFLGRAATEGSAAHVDAPYRLEVLDGVPHWLPELAGDTVAELVAAHVKANG